MVLRLSPPGSAIVWPYEQTEQYGPGARIPRANWGTHLMWTAAYRCLFPASLGLPALQQVTLTHWRCGRTVLSGVGATIVLANSGMAPRWALRRRCNPSD